MDYRAFVMAALLLAPPRIADACSCYDVPPCQGFWLADSVFTGVVTSITHPAEGRPTQTRTETTILVERGFKGENDQVVIRGNARNTMNTCMFHFKAGERYIVYARRERDGSLTTNMCSGTKRLAQAKGDLDYAQHLPRPGSGGRIYGDVRRAHTNLLDSRESRVEPAPGISVTLRDSKGSARELNTNRAGKFEAKGLKPDTYSVSLRLPDTMRAYYDRSEIELKDRACAPFSIWFEPNGRIAGRVVDAAGRPEAGARVLAVSEQYTNKNEYPNANLQTGMTDETGRYEIGPLPAGEYHVGVNIEWAPTTKAPYAPTFYPGVLTRGDAATIALTDGELRRGVDFALPRRLAALAVSGTVTTADGTPAAGAFVQLQPANGGESSTATTDASGAFTVTGLSGVSYVLYSTLRVAGKLAGMATVPISIGEAPVTGVALVLKERD